MNKKLTIALVIGIAILLVAYFFWYRKPEDPLQIPNITTEETGTTSQEQNSSEITYTNTDYHFRFTLPKSWEGYSIIQESWKGDSFDESTQSQVTTETGPLISIRHPDWDYKSPRQDIPIMVFTIKQWNEMQNDEFHIGAAPINPTELARNNEYVFALPARYNFAYITGYQEVENIISSNPLSGFNP